MIDDEVVRALRSVVPSCGEAAATRDLWPEVARRISAPRAVTARGDWVLAALAAVSLLVFPRGITALLYLL